MGSVLLPQLIAPRDVAVQEPFDIVGANFSGEAYSDTVVLGNLPAFVLAASPVSLVAQPNPRTSPGLAELVAGLTGTGNLASLPVTVVSLQVRGPAKPLTPGGATVFPHPRQRLESTLAARGQQPDARCGEFRPGSHGVLVDVRRASERGPAEVARS